MALILAVVASPATAAPAGASSALEQAQSAIRAKHFRQAIEGLATRLAAKPDDPAAPKLLLLLGEAAESYVGSLNSRYRSRSRLNPESPAWLASISQERRWAEAHLASFSYYDPRGSYRYEGDAYRVLTRRFPQDPLAEEAEWRLIPRSDDGEHHLQENPALIDASRHERFLRRYPTSSHALSARLAIGWDYLYASGFTWGKPNARRFAKGKHILENVVAQAPGSQEARQARNYLARAANPFGYVPSAEASHAVAPAPSRR